MFWKVLAGIVAFLMVVVLGAMMLAAVGVTAAGAALVSVVDNLDVSTVQVTDDSGHTESYSVNDLLSETGRVEVTGRDGERVTIDVNVPQITVQESGEEAGRVVIGGESGLSINADGQRIQFDGRSIDNFDGRFFGRFFAGLFSGLFKLVVWTLIAVGIWLVLRNQRPAAKEKSVDATA